MEDLPPAADQGERLWAHYQNKPAAKQWPDDRVPANRHDWSLEVLRLDLSLQTRAVASALAWLGNADGSHMVPADPKLLNVVDLSYRTAVGTHIATLLRLQLLHKTHRAGGRTKRPYDEFHLSLPADLGILPYRLDADFDRIEQRTKGAVPVKAILASKTARLERNTASGENTAAPAHGRQRPSVQSVATEPIGRKRASGETTGRPPLREKPASVQSAAPPTVERQQPSTRTPVDNPHGRKPPSVQSGDPDPGVEKPPSVETVFERKASALSTEGQRTFNGSPASEPMFLNPKTHNPTTRVVSLGGDLTSAGPPEHEDPHVPVPFQPTDDPEYDEARTVVATVPLEELAVLLGDAQGELEAEFAAAAGVEDDGVITFGGDREILIRAAQIVRRGETYGGPQ